MVIGPLPVATPDPSATVRVLDREPTAARLTIHYRSASPNLLRVAIPAYPGWHASLNGGDLPTLTVDEALLGILVPPGEADIQLWYVPKYFWPAAAVSALTLLATIIILILRPNKH